MWVGVICPDGGLITLGETMEKKMEDLKTWRITYTAELVSKHEGLVAIFAALIAGGVIAHLFKDIFMFGWNLL